MTNTAITYPLTSQIVKARTYRRKEDGWTNFESNQLNRRLDFLFRMGDYNPYHKKLVSGFVTNHVAIDSGRVMWAAGSDKEYNPFGYSAYYNCSGMLFTNPHDFIRSFSNLFLGCGQGEVIIENLPEFIGYLVGSLEGDQFEFPLINNVFNINFSGYFGEYDFEHPSYTDTTKLYVGENKITIEVGDSREGWASAYNVLLELYTNGVYFLEDKDKYGIPVITYQNTSDFLSTNCINGFDIDIILSSIRPYGTPIKGFGGVANPLYTATFFTNITNILNNAALTQEGQLNTLDISLLLNESAAWCHSGGGRRSAKINQFKQDDTTADAKQGLWQQLPDGSWVVDEKKAALKFSNFTKMYFTKPTYEEVESTVSKQFFCGEGAIQYVPVALARANIDKFDNETEAISTIVNAFETNTQSQLFLEDDYKLRLHRMTRFQLNPCAEVIGSDFYCNLSSIQFNPLINAYYRLLEEAGTDETESISTLTSLMYEAFYAGGIIAAPLLKHKFADEKFQYSREVDPIVLVSFTELFEFFAWLFGPRWCEWWLAAPPGLTLENDWPLTGRPDTWKVTIEDSDKKYLDRIRELHRWLNDWYFEHAPLVGEDDGSYPQWGPVVDYGVLFRDTEQLLFSFWKNVVFESLQDYCQEHNLTPPNRCTGLKPEGTQTLLTGHSAGWHPPYAKYYIRRITMDPGTAVAQACLALGYEVVPGQTDVDPETGVLLTDPFDSRVKNWLVEVPICVETIPDWFDPSKITALAQYKFWMQVQKYYTTHNTSSTILLKEEEIPVLASQIYHDIAENEPYMSTALLARDETTFPRMPYEVCSKEEFERRYNNIDRTTDFYSLVEKYETHKDSYAGPSGCDSDFCEMK